MADDDSWPLMLWIGGAPGAGKSTLAWRLSRTWDLPLHSVDLWSYDHQARLPERESLDEELARGPEAAADAFEAVSRARLDLVLADIAARDLGPVPALVEGPQLSPDLAPRLPVGGGVWLVPDPERTRLARQERLAGQERLARQEALAGQPTASQTRAEAVLARDAILAERIQRTAAQAHRPVVHVPADPDWPTIAAAIEAAFGPALRAAPRLPGGTALSGQRRYENQVAVRQGRLWARAAGFSTMPRYPFACECGISRCRATWPVAPDEYEARTVGQTLVLHDMVRPGSDRIGS